MKLNASLTPPAEVVRYDLWCSVDGPGLEKDKEPEGEWVRYEDHAAALAASEAKRKDAEAMIVTLTAGDPTKWPAPDQPKTEDAA